MVFFNFIILLKVFYDQLAELWSVFKHHFFFNLTTIKNETYWGNIETEAG